MASGDEKAASKAGHMAAPTTTCSVSNTLANGEPSTHGAVADPPLCCPVCTPNKNRSPVSHKTTQALSNRSVFVHVPPMGHVKLRRIEDMAGRGVHLRATCPKCGHSATFDPHGIARFFMSAGWNTSLDVAPYRFRCAQCGAKPCTLAAIAVDTEMPAIRPLPMQPPPCPPGVDPSAWAMADTRERKRLIERSRN
jgi:hypothetical protein